MKLLKQIDYFKFCRAFPEFIDIDDTIEMKLVLLKYIKSQNKKKNGKYQLPSILQMKMPNSSSYFRKWELMKKDYYYHIMYKKEIILNIHFINDDKFCIYMKQTRNSTILSNEEITNLKRTILIDEMMK